MKNKVTKTSSVTDYYSNPIPSGFFDNLDAASDEYQKHGKISKELFKKILGEPPVLKDKATKAEKLEYFKNISDYNRMKRVVEIKIAMYAGKRA